jgi:class 3 adenylate cyclase
MTRNDDEITRLDDLLRQRADLDERLARYKREFAILFADISGSTSFYDRRGDVSGIVMVQQFLDRARGAVEPYGGRVVKTMGDAVLVHFEEARDALRGAVALHDSLGEFNRTRAEADRISLRMGLSWGSGFIKDNDVFGTVVNMAARLEQIAEPGQILVMAAFHNAARELEGALLARLSEEQLRGKDAPQEIYELIWPDAAMAHGEGTRAYSLLHVMADGEVDKEYRLEQTETLLGRSRGSIQFPGDQLLSPIHARFVVARGRLRIEDMSESGVFLRVREPMVLQSGDVIVAGRTLLLFVAGPKPGQGTLGYQEKRFPLQRRRTVIGRREGDVVLAEESFLSSRHARIRNEEGVFYLEDLRSTNGTFLKVRGNTTLAPGDEILCGAQLLRVRGVE